MKMQVFATKYRERFVWIECGESCIFMDHSGHTELSTIPKMKHFLKFCINLPSVVDLQLELLHVNVRYN